MIAALLIGFGLGFFVAAQLGPMSLLAIRSTLRNGVCGRARDRRRRSRSIDTLYAAAGAAGRGRGAARSSRCGSRSGSPARPCSSTSARRTLWSAFRVRLGGETGEEVATPRARVRRSRSARPPRTR